MFHIISMEMLAVWDEANFFLHLICISITLQEPEVSQAYLKNHQYLLLVFNVVSSQRYEVQ
jgi:hypothetical protein